MTITYIPLVVLVSLRILQTLFWLLGISLAPGRKKMAPKHTNPKVASTSRMRDRSLDLEGSNFCTL